MKLRSLGDTVLLSGPLLELRKAYPNAEIHVAAVSQWTPILKKHPAIDQLWPYERHADRTARAKAAARLALRLREQRFDCVVNFHASPSSAMISRATGAPVRSVHFHGHKDKNRFSTVKVPGKGTLKPIIERDMDTLRALGLEIPAGRLPRIFLEESELETAKQNLDRLGLSGPILGLGLGASRSTKTWPLARFAELTVRWCKETGGSAFAIAGPDEEAELARFHAAVDLIPESGSFKKKIAGSTSLGLRGLSAFLSHFSVFAGNDSGPKHMAIAVVTPTVTMFGPEHPFEWHPYPRDKHPYFFIETLACRRDAMPGMPAWCGIPECVQEKHQCMTLISVDQVFAECLKISKHPG